MGFRTHYPKIKIKKIFKVKKKKKKVEKGTAEEETVGCHHQFKGHECEQTVGDGEGQGILACCSSWGRKELDTT